jgi:hypothetical protein
MWYVVAFTLAGPVAAEADVLRVESARLGRELADVRFLLMTKQYRHGGTALTEDMTFHHVRLSELEIQAVFRRQREAEAQMRMDWVKQELNRIKVEREIEEIEKALRSRTGTDPTEVLRDTLESLKLLEQSLRRPPPPTRRTTWRLPPDLGDLRQKNDELRYRIDKAKRELIELAVGAHPYVIRSR